MLQVLPLLSHHLYWYGEVPPDAFAVKVIVVPAACGDALSAVVVANVRGADAVTVYATSLYAS